MKAKESDGFHNAAAEYVIDIAKDLRLAENACTCQSEIPWGVQEGLSVGSREPPSRGVPSQPIELNKTTPTNTPCLVLPVANAEES